MNHAAFVGFIPKKAPVVVLAFVVQLASDDNAIVINAVLGDDLYAGSVGLMYMWRIGMCTPYE